MIDISQFGKGAIPTPKVIRDQQFRIMAAAPVVDWSQPYKVPASFPVKNQMSASDCTAEATLYYARVLGIIENSEDREDSERFNYSQSFIAPDGGAFIWKAMSIPLKPGLATLQSVPNGDHSELTMRDGSLNAAAKIEAKADKYAVIPRSNIDQMAQIIRDYHGFVTGFNGWNGMFDASGQVIDWSKSDWGHAVYIYGYEIRNGIKCLRFRNSWSDKWGSGGDGFFPEAFVNSGMMFDCYTYASIADLDPTSMNNRLVKLNDPNSKDIFLVVDGKRTLVQNVGAFKLLGGNIDTVEKLTQDQINALPDSGRTLAEIIQE